MLSMQEVCPGRRGLNRCYLIMNLSGSFVICRRVRRVHMTQISLLLMWRAKFKSANQAYSVKILTGAIPINTMANVNKTHLQYIWSNFQNHNPFSSPLHSTQNTTSRERETTRDGGGGKHIDVHKPKHQTPIKPTYFIALSREKGGRGAQCGRQARNHCQEVGLEPG